MNRPTKLAITPDGQTVYVVSGASTLTPIDVATRTAGTPIALAHQGEAIAITPDGALAVVGETQGEAPNESAFVQVIDLSNDTPEAPVAIAAQPAGPIAIAPNGRTAYVVARDENRYGGDPDKPGAVFAFDIASRTLGAKLPLQAEWFNPGSLVVSGDSTHLYGSLTCAYRLPICGAGRVFDWSVRVPLRCTSGVTCRGRLTLTSGKRTCATPTFRIAANRNARQRLTVRRTCRPAKLSATTSTGQVGFTKTVRVVR